MILTIQEIEAACDASQPLDFTRHVDTAPEIPLRQTFHPFGFPAEVRTNSAEVLAFLETTWGLFGKRFGTKTILIDIYVVESDSTECPPRPEYRIMESTYAAVANRKNFCIADMSRGKSQMTISTAALLHKSYLWTFFLEFSVGVHISTRFATPVHAGCVALDGRGVLLSGDSGVGKSTLTYALARAGWEYVSDDCSFLLNCSKQRVVTGNTNQVRFRPSAGDLFPEIAGMEVTPRAEGKPSIEFPTESMLHITRAETVQADFMVFLNRHSGGPPQLVPYRKDVARQFMRQTLYGSAQSLALQYAAIEQLLTAEVFELRYTDLDWAIERLRMLVQESR